MKWFAVVIDFDGDVLVKDMCLTTTELLEVSARADVYAVLRGKRDGLIEILSDIRCDFFDLKEMSIEELRGKNEDAL